jgi:flavin reductase (DIM6/NTAB) family NADH-FMN oxidoreductase RutF
VSDDAFARICGEQDAPMAIVTAFDGHERSGCLVGFHTQCSIVPRRWLACISKPNHTYRVAAGAQRLVLHLLRSDQHDLAQLFGGETGDALAPATKFERCAWHPAADGTPVLDGCDWIAGTVVERIDFGDHVGHLIEVDDAGLGHAPADQLGARAVHDIRPGHPAS